MAIWTDIFTEHVDCQFIICLIVIILAECDPCRIIIDNVCSRTSNQTFPNITNFTVHQNMSNRWLYPFTDYQGCFFNKMGVHNLLMLSILKISAAQLAWTHCEHVMGVLAFSIKNKANIDLKLSRNMAQPGVVLKHITSNSLLLYCWNITTPNTASNDNKTINNNRAFKVEFDIIHLPVADALR